MNLFRTIQLTAISLAVSASMVFGAAHLVYNLDTNTSTMVGPIPMGKPMVNLKKLDPLEVELEKLTEEQYQVMLGIMHYGDEYELGMTLAAIAWKESGFGKFNMNLGDGEYGSFGPFHIRLDYAAKRHNKTSDWSRSRLAERLLYDLEFATKEAANVLKSFKNKKCNYSCSLARYNGGYTAHKNSKALDYAKDVKKRVKAIEKYVSRNYVIVKMDTINTYGSEAQKIALNTQGVNFIVKE